MSRPKIGAVSYLNTKPLVAGLADEARDFELIFDLPSRLADRLAAADLDVALIPVIEAITHPEYTVVSDACIACRGPVWSVKLMSRLPAEEIQTLALDVGSRTSRILTRIFLAKQFGIRPQIEPLSMEQRWYESPTDAALIIGDRAMKAEHDAFPHVWDLGEAWFQWTNRPFVFAVWAARPGADLDRIDGLLSAARDRGLKQLDRIADAEAGKYRLSHDECTRYLNHYLHFHLGAEEKSGMDLYFKYASELSLIKPNLQLQFHDCQTA